jgi:glycosyltransferase involved in cell wall biosynthesis
MPAGDRLTVLHFVAADADRGGILSVVRGLADAGEFTCVLGVNPGFQQVRQPRLETREFPRLAGEAIGPRTMIRALGVARAARSWLRADAARIFHGHSRAGLLIALWLRLLGEQRVVASVHCYGRQRWFYRLAARLLKDRLYWLSPAMRRYYGLSEAAWSHCIPECVPDATAAPSATSGPRTPGRLRIGGAGMIVRWKAWHLVVEALALLPVELRSRVAFEHIGAPDGSPESQAYAAELHQLAKARGVEAQICWRGAESSSAKLLAEIDALVVASHNEPFSVAMLEALAAGVPVLAADSGGAVDVVVSGRTGWLFRDGDAGDLARHLEALLSPAPWQGIQITRDGLTRFAASVVARQWVRVYEGFGPNRP